MTHSNRANSEEGETEGKGEMKFHGGKIVKQCVGLKIPNGADGTAF